VAGIGRMKYSLFLFYNAFGGVLWVLICLLAGYFLGNISVVKENFSIAVLVIIVISILPIIFEFWKHRTQTAGQKS
jgi:membrane-associated protein